MPRVLIIAYGNPLRRDDSLAWRTAEQLSQLDLPRDVEILTCHQLTPEQAFPISSASRVIFIDAASTGAPGQLVSVPLKPQPEFSLSTHQCSPAAILSLALKLYGVSPEAVLISVAGECFEFGEALSSKVMETLPRVLALVEELSRPQIAARFN